MRILTTAILILCAQLTWAQDATVVDPQGDAAAGMGMPGLLHDLDSMTVQLTDTALEVELSFHNPISPPSAFAPDSISGLVEFDLDQDPTTGSPPIQSLFSPPFANLSLGVDAVVMLDTENAGFVNVVDGMFNFLGLGSIQFTANSATLSIPLTIVGSTTAVDFTTIIGTVAQPTDALEVIGTVTTSGGGTEFLRGDALNDGVVNLTDALNILLYAAGEVPAPSCLAACDTDANGAINLADSILLLNYLFLQGSPPAAPFPDCDTDAGTLSCDSYTGCTN